VRARLDLRELEGLGERRMPAPDDHRLQEARSDPARLSAKVLQILKEEAEPAGQAAQK
jgi:hypothetical protein